MFSCDSFTPILNRPFSEFTYEWWAWMCATGLFLACTLGCKMVGLFTFFTIGTAVLVDLWDILDIRKRYPIVSMPFYCLFPY